MPTTYPKIRPFPLTQIQLVARRQVQRYDAGLTESSQYVIGDIVTLRGSSGVAKEVEASTASNITRLAVACQDYADSQVTPRMAFFRNGRGRGVPVDFIDERDEWVMTWAHTIDATAITAVENHVQRDIIYDASAGVLNIAASAETSVAVELLRFFNGSGDTPTGAVVGDVNPRVVVRFLPAKLAK